MHRYIVLIEYSEQMYAQLIKVILCDTWRGRFNFCATYKCDATVMECSYKLSAQLISSTTSVAIYVALLSGLITC